MMASLEIGASPADLREDIGQGRGAVQGEGLATGFPAGEGEGEDKVVMRGAASPAEEFGAEGFGGFAGEHDFE